MKNGFVLEVQAQQQRRVQLGSERQLAGTLWLCDSWVSKVLVDNKSVWTVWASPNPRIEGLSVRRMHCVSCRWVKAWRTPQTVLRCTQTLLEQDSEPNAPISFEFFFCMLLHTPSSLHLEGIYCMFYHTTFIRQRRITALFKQIWLVNHKGKGKIQRNTDIGRIHP